MGKDGAVGLITYMRTDSTRISDDAINDVRDFITERYGKEFLPAARQRLQIEEGRAGCARSHPTYFDGLYAGGGGEVSRRKTR